jgi:hypothetical protein
VEKVIKASLDRFEGDYAVVYSNEDGTKFDVPAEMLSGTRPGSRLKLHVEGVRILSIDVDSKTTSEARDRIRSKYERLRKRR